MYNNWLCLLLFIQTCCSFSLSSPPPGRTDAITNNNMNAATTKWQPKKIPSSNERQRLRDGIKYESETIGTLGFHHIEFYCGDAKSTAYRLAMALGMSMTGITGQSTGNDKHISYGLECGDVRFLVTAPYSMVAASSMNTATCTNQIEFDAPDVLPSFSQHEAHTFFAKHGWAVRAVALEVNDVVTAYQASVKCGAKSILEPTFVPICRAQQKLLSNWSGEEDDAVENNLQDGCYMAEVELYGDVVLRYIGFTTQTLAPSIRSTDTQLPFLPHLAPMVGKNACRPTFGLRCIDHAVGNVPDLQTALNYVQSITGFHEFAEFTSDDVGTLDSGLNSVVLASDTEDVLLPLNEPTEGKRKSQIQTFLEQNEGAGLQHLALKTDDIFDTIRRMRGLEDGMGGFELMQRPSDSYYQELPERLGDKLKPEQYVELRELGILADADDEGVLLQIFTKPIGDRPTFFFEIIQRIGCIYTTEDSMNRKSSERPGCGGFGQGNFRELFRSIEEHEKTLKV